MATLPDFVIKRLRVPVPEGCSVVPGSTPVLAFGDPQTARVATLGLNPSRKEFLDRHGRELLGDMRRFETLRSVGVTRLEDADDSVLEQVFAGCCAYFSRRPYRQWFDKLEAVVQSAGGSYYGGTACHLDLVQWATDPVWNKLDRLSVRRRLLDSDTPFLLEQLRGGQMTTLLLNGNSVIAGLESVAGIRLEQFGRLSGPARAPSKLVEGSMEGGVRVIGWTFNLQSSHGVTVALRSELTVAVASKIRDGWPAHVQRDA